MRSKTAPCDTPSKVTEDRKKRPTNATHAIAPPWDYMCNTYVHDHTPPHATSSHDPASTHLQDRQSLMSCSTMSCSRMSYLNSNCSATNCSLMAAAMETQRSCSLTACVSSASPRPWNYTCNTYDPTHTSSHVRLCHDTASTDLPDTPLSGAAQAQAQGPYAPNAFPPPWHYTTNTYDPPDMSSDAHKHCSRRDYRYIYPNPDSSCHTSPTVSWWVAALLGRR